MKNLFYFAMFLLLIAAIVLFFFYIITGNSLSLFLSFASTSIVFVLMKWDTGKKE